MPKGHVYDNETSCHFDTCGCVVVWNDDLQEDEKARDASVQFAKTCPAHAGISAFDVMSQNRAKNIALRVFVDSLPYHAFRPVFDEHAMPTPILDKAGNVEAWRYEAANVAARRLHVPATYSLDHNTGAVKIAHPHITPEIHAAIDATLAADPHTRHLPAHTGKG